MPCPTCDHSMELVHEGEEYREEDQRWGDITVFVYWCPRCGTVRIRKMDDAGLVEGKEHTPNFRFHPNKLKRIIQTIEEE